MRVRWPLVQHTSNSHTAHSRQASESPSRDKECTKRTPGTVGALFRIVVRAVTSSKDDRTRSAIHASYLRRLPLQHPSRKKSAFRQAPRISHRDSRVTQYVVLFLNQTCPSLRHGRNVHSKVSRSLYLQFALLIAASCVLHRDLNRVVHHEGLISVRLQAPFGTRQLGRSEVYMANVGNGVRWRRPSLADLEYSLHKAAAAHPTSRTAKVRFRKAIRDARKHAPRTPRQSLHTLSNQRFRS